MTSEPKMMWDELLDMEVPYVKYEPAYMIVDNQGYAHTISATRAIAMRRQLELGLRSTTTIVKM